MPGPLAGQNNPRGRADQWATAPPTRLRNAGHAALQQVHPGEAETETLEARVELAVGRSRQRDKRTTLCAAVIERRQHGIGAEAQLADRIGGARGAAVGEAGQPLDEGQEQIRIEIVLRENLPSQPDPARQIPEDKVA